MPVVLEGLSVFLLALLFAWAAVAKLVRFRAWRTALHGYRLPGEAALAVGVPSAEAGVPILVLMDRSRAAAALALALLALFSLALLRARTLRGNKLPCGCFGGAGERDYRLMLARNGTLGLLAGTVLMARRDVRALEDLGAPDASEAIPAALALLGIVILAWLAWTLSSTLRGGRS